MVILVSESWWFDFTNCEFGAFADWRIFQQFLSDISFNVFPHDYGDKYFSIKRIMLLVYSYMAIKKYDYLEVNGNSS